MFKENDIDMSKMNKNLEDKTEEIPKPNYNIFDIVIYNRFGRFADENDELLIITGRKYGHHRVGAGKDWLYAGIAFKMVKTRSKGLPIMPLDSHLLYEITEVFLTTREDLFSY